MLFSVIVPVHNRPEEIDELLNSLTAQTFDNFEVLIIEDGSANRCENVVKRYMDSLNLRYFFKENSGQGFSRNYGFERAKGKYLVVFDSDCIIPPHYFQAVSDRLAMEKADAWGGPDKSHPEFTTIQKAISYAMTSPFTTGGIRGRKKRAGTFHPRSFNMGISREVFQQTGGYRITRMGEDLEFSIRIKKAGFRVILIEDAFVYHKRRSDFCQFYRQLFFFGRARINIYRFHIDDFIILHVLPALFVVWLGIILVMLAVNRVLFLLLLLPFLLYALLLFVHSYHLQRRIILSAASVFASYIQLIAYGTGFLRELGRYLWTPFKR